MNLAIFDPSITALPIEMKFLVIQQKMIGDVLASTVICESIKHYFPNSSVHFVANENTLPVLLNNPSIDRVVVFGKDLRQSKWKFYRFLKAIQKEEFHTVIDAYGKLESNLISLFARSKYKISHFKGYTRWIYTHTVKENLNPDGKIPLAIQNRLALLGPILNRPNDFVTFPKIFLKESEIHEAKNKIDTIRDYKNQKLVMIGILGSSPLKTYPSAYMAKILDFICEKTNTKLLFNYIPNQKSDAEAIYNQCNETTKSKSVLDFYAPSLREFLAILSQCSALIGNEGGAVNMAKALDIPTFCIFSPFIIKGAWHSNIQEKHFGVHLIDYLPELFENKGKKDIKRNIDTLYETFKTSLFIEQLGNFLSKYGQ
ncbi:glycosyltransferase family 9 protein [Maribacter algicola]|uniref:Glycosyltransferase family 9 protein n=1 Tax=Meishania litoralis TaxID=3434685 RepID=A0ACC7LEL0_9FLAO